MVRQVYFRQRALNRLVMIKVLLMVTIIMLIAMGFIMCNDIAGPE